MFQQKVFSKIISQYDNQTDALDAISKVLFLDKTSIYRRITGTVSLKIEELQVLIQTYNISLDDIVYANHEICLGYSFMNDKALSIDEMFDLKKLDPYLYIPNLTIYLWGHGLIVEHLYAYPELAYFKLHVWDRLFWKTGKYVNFSLKKLDNYTIEKIKTYYWQAHRFDSVEILHKESLNLDLEQIRYAYETKAINKEDAYILLDCFDQFVNLHEKRVTTGSKLLQEEDHLFEVYYAEQPQTGDFYLAKSPSFACITNTFVPPQVVISYDPKLIKRGWSYFQKLKSRSIKISKTGELTRRTLFNHYRRVIEQVRRKII